jgi:outer membrane protein assembly factor BamB
MLAPVKKYLPKRTAIYFVLACMVLASGCYDQDAWPTIHGDARNSDTAPYPGHTQIQKRWHRWFPGYVAAAATIDSQGQIYVTTTGDGVAGECHLYVIDLATGANKWCNSLVNRWVVGSSVLIDAEGNLFVGDDVAMRSFDRDGNLRWETATVGAAISAQFTSDSHLIFITHIGQIMILERATGNPVVPTYELLPGQTYVPGTGLNDCLFGGPTCPSANTLSVSHQNNNFYMTLRPLGAAAAELRALRYDRPGGQIIPLWSNAALEGGTASSPVISEDGTRVYVNDNDGNLVALKSWNGEIIWELPIGFSPAGSPSVTADGRIVPAGAANSTLLAVQDNGPTGTISWLNASDVNVGVSVQVNDDILYAMVRTPETQLNVDFVSLDATTGQEHDRVTITPFPAATVGTSVAADGTVVVAGINGIITAWGGAD